MEKGGGWMNMPIAQRALTVGDWKKYGGEGPRCLNPPTKCLRHTVSTKNVIQDLVWHWDTRSPSLAEGGSGVGEDDTCGRSAQEGYLSFAPKMKGIGGVLHFRDLHDH